MRAFALTIFLAAFAVRIAAALALPRELAVFPDSADYLRIAEHIVAGEGIVLHEQAKAKRLPVYPVFLAAHRAVFGDDLLPAQISQGFLGALACALLFLLADRVFGRRPAMWASAGLALHPLLAAVSAAILIESLLLFLLLLEMFLLYRATETGRHGFAAGAGLACGAATLLQAGHAFFFLFAAPFVMRASRPRRTWPVLATFVLASLVLPAAWAVRNATVLGRFVPLTTASGYTLYESFGPGATGGTAGHVMIWPDRDGRDEVEYDAHLRRKALDAALGDPGRSLRLALEKQRRFWSVAPDHGGFRSAPAIAASLASFGPVLVFFVVGLFRLRRIGWDAAWFLAPPAYFALVHAVFLGSIRYRMPVEPFLIGLAAWAAADVWEQWRRRKRS